MIETNLRKHESENKILSRQEILDAYQSTYKASSFVTFKNVTAKALFSYEDMLDDDVFMNKAVTVHKDYKPSTMQSYLGHWITYWKIAGLDEERVIQLRSLIRNGIDREVRTPKPPGYWDLNGDDTAWHIRNLPDVPCIWSKNGNPTEDIQQENEEDTDKSGYVYGISNPSMPGLIKIGMTTRTPENRLKNANKSRGPFGPPTPYKIEFAKKVCDACYCEKIIHIELQDYREDPKREWFKVSLEKALKTIDKLDGIKCTNITKKNIEEDPEKLKEKRLLNLRNARDAIEMRKRYEEDNSMYDKSRLFWLSKPVGGNLKNYTLDTINNTGKQLDKKEFKYHMYNLDEIKCHCWMK